LAGAFVLVAVVFQFWHIMDGVPDQPRRVEWLVDSLTTLRRFPVGVRHKLGFALYLAQIGERHESAKRLHGFEGPVWEVGAEDRSGTYRAVYVVNLGDAVYVLHAFQKKSKTGMATPRSEIDLIRRRLKLALKMAGR
jgi:phage-related protein